MKDQISELYSSYGKYINKYRAFPLVYDGLKIVERRLLYSLFERAKDKFVKSAEVVGWCIGQYHPHGDQSAYGSLASLVQGGLAVGQGNWGIDTGIIPCEPAAMRYTEVKSNKMILDMAFEYIKYVKMEELEIYSEPIFLPTKLPLCLVNKNYCQGIGFGSRTLIPSYKIEDLILRLKWLLGYEKKEPIIRPITDCVYSSTDKDFKELLTIGKAKIDFKGKIEVDYSTKSVIVKSIPPSKTFSGILKKMEKDIQVLKNFGFIDESTDKTKVRFTCIKRGVKLDTLVKKLNYNLAGSVTFECNMCDENGNVVLTSIDDMLMNVYKNYASINEVVLKSEISKIQKHITELQLIDKIKKVLPKWLKQNPDEPDIVISGVHTDTNIPELKVKELFEKYTILKILKVKTETTELAEKKVQLETNLNNLHTYIWNEKYTSYLT